MLTSLALVLLLYAPSVAVLFALPRSSSRRLLASALAFVVPLAGPVLALLVARVRSGTLEAREPPADEVAPGLMGADEAESIGVLPPLLERLLSSDPPERLSALVVLSQKSDAEAVDMLRWTLENGSPEAVLDAALVLEELELDWERRRHAAERAVIEKPDASRAVAAADAAADGILTGLSDPAIAPVLAERARKYYRMAVKLAPERERDIDLRLARLELAVGNPRAALKLTERARARLEDGDEVPEELSRLADRARFAARQRGEGRGQRPLILTRTLPWSGKWH